MSVSVCECVSVCVHMNVDLSESHYLYTCYGTALSPPYSVGIGLSRARIM